MKQLSAAFLSVALLPPAAIAETCTKDFHGTMFCGADALRVEQIMGGNVHRLIISRGTQQLRALITIEAMNTGSTQTERREHLVEALRKQKNIARVAFKDKVFTETEPQVQGDWLVAKRHIEPPKNWLGRPKEGLSARYMTAMGCETAYVLEQLISEKRPLEMAIEIENFVLSHARASAMKDNKECPADG